jgi:RimJ/RimL family protein N-acetyltransferase
MIRGSLVILRPAQEQDRPSVYAWLALSDVTPSMLGPPTYLEAPIPSWDEFCADYVSRFFDGAQPQLGRSFIIEREGAAVGHVSYSKVERGRGSAELDIWLRSEASCGRGYGPDALTALTRYLHKTLGLREFIMRPSRRNQRAIKAYDRAGFVLQPLTPAQQAALYGPGDHYDTVVMCLKLADGVQASAATSWQGR